MEESNGRMRIAFDFVLELIRLSPRRIGYNVSFLNVIESLFSYFPFLQFLLTFLSFVFFVFRSLSFVRVRMRIVAVCFASRNGERGPIRGTDRK